MDRAIVEQAVRALAAMNSARNPKARTLAWPAVAPTNTDQPNLPPPANSPQAAESACWHCQGKRQCSCISCLEGPLGQIAAPCVVCQLARCEVKSKPQ